MGWYTSGPGDLEYKYGDVVAAARASGLGTLLVVPRVTTDDGTEEFLGPLQTAIEKAGLPWRHIDFAVDADPWGESIRVALDFDPLRTLEDLASLVAGHAGSIKEIFARGAGDGWEMLDLTVSMECVWTVTTAELPALVEWLNAGLGDETPISIERLREGGLDRGWYQPPETLAATFECLDEDARRHLTAYGLAAAVLTGDEFQLGQPDEVYNLVVPEDEDEEEEKEDGSSPGAVLFRPADHPFLELLAEAFDVSPALRERVFYAHGPHPVRLPPEPDTPAEDLLTGLSYAKYAARLLNMFARDRLAERQDGGYPVTYGWHASATRDELAQVFAGSGFTVYSMDETVADYRRDWGDVDGPLYDVLRQRRLDLLEAGDPGGDPVVGFIVRGGDVPPVPSIGKVGLLLVLVEELDIPRDQRERLELVLRSAAPEVREELRGRV